jgi:hypothetical protein
MRSDTLSASNLYKGAMAAITFNATHRLRHPRRAQLDSLEQAQKPATAMIEPMTPFQPLDPDIVSASIPAFFIGRNKTGLWVAREAKGRTGGIFLLKRSAVEFAKEESEPSRCALIFPSETFELDIENRGNPLIAQFARWIDQAKRHFTHLAPR